jgi:hypothetical protein
MASRLTATQVLTLIHEFFLQGQNSFPLSPDAALGEDDTPLHQLVRETLAQEAYERQPLDFAYFVPNQPEPDGEYRPRIVRKNDHAHPGGHPLNYTWGADYHRAWCAAQRKNRSMGLSEQEEARIIADAVRLQRPVPQCERCGERWERYEAVPEGVRKGCSHCNPQAGAEYERTTTAYDGSLVRVGHSREPRREFPTEDGTVTG